VGSPHGVAGKIGSESLPVSGARMPGCWTVPVQRHLKVFRQRLRRYCLQFLDEFTPRDGYELSRQRQ
jgi:hypothetical protein